MSSPSLFSLVRSSCARCVSTSPHVRIDEVALRAFVSAHVSTATPASLRGAFMSMPLRFGSVEQELDCFFYTLLLNVGSGFRHELHKSTDAGAWDTILRGVVRLHIEGRVVNADFLCGLTPSAVAELFSLPLTVDVPVMPAVYEARRGPLAPLIDALVGISVEAGRVLVARKVRTFAELFAQRAAAGAGAGAGGGLSAAAEPASAAAAAAAPAEAASDSLLRFLVDTFPSMRDVTRVRGEDVYLLKKAQLASSMLQRVFAKKLPALFAADAAREGGGAASAAPAPASASAPASADVAVEAETPPTYTIFADNVIPAVLRATGVLVLSDSVRSAIEARQDIPAGEVETDLRAAAVVACGQIVKEAHAFYAAASLAVASAAAAPAAASTAESAVSTPGAVSGTATAAPLLVGDDAARAPAAEAILSAAAAPAAAASVPAAAAPPNPLLATLTEVQLDSFIWGAMGKKPEFRAVERHATKDTRFY